MQTIPIRLPNLDRHAASGTLILAHKARAFAKAHMRRVPRGDAEAHRLRGRARVQLAIGEGPSKIMRLDITNVLSGNDYSAQLAIGGKGAMANVLLDTGSSTLAVDPSVYDGSGDNDLKTGTLMQFVKYGTGGWARPVVNTTLTFGTGAGAIAMPNCPDRDHVSAAERQLPGCDRHHGVGLQWLERCV